jgi:L-Ala-D/L-Glu epimerase
MSERAHIVCLRLYPLSIPLRQTFRHAAHARRHADPVIVEIELADGTLGYGETLPRPYVSGETLDSVIEAIQDPILDELLGLRPQSFAEALERIEALPTHDELGRVITAARAGVELALLDAYSRHFRKPIEEVFGWLGLAGFGGAGSLPPLRYSGVISADEVKRLRWSVRKMRLFGLRDFKLKVGNENDPERIRAVARVLKLEGASGDAGTRRLGDQETGRGRSNTLRLDSNGKWDVKEAIQVLMQVEDLPIRYVEQPLGREQEADLLTLRETTGVKIVHDESLVTMGDAERLVSMGVADAFNIRISKNGGFLAAIRLAHFARKHGVRYQLGCMVGETSILSAVGRIFLQHVPGVMFAEGSYGRFLLRGDIVSKQVRFGYGGKGKPITGLGWGVDVKKELLLKYTPANVLEMPL